MTKGRMAAYWRLLPMGPWGLMLMETLREANPSWYAEMSRKGELETWAEQRATEAVTRYDQLIEQGTDPTEARELALGEMLEGL
jgi:hypothetical protein